MAEVIDRKFQFIAVNPCKPESFYTQENGIVFAAKDKALLPALYAYLNACKTLGCDKSHTESMNLLIDRVREFQKVNGTRVPDTESDCEIDRCIGGNLERRKI